MAKRQVEEHREQYEQMVAEDREVDRSFRRDFADCEPHVDQLYKLFRKRPRWVRTLAPLSVTTSHPHPSTFTLYCFTSTLISSMHYSLSHSTPYSLRGVCVYNQCHSLTHSSHSGQRLKLGPSEGGLVPDPSSQNPFAQRPSSAVGGGRGENPMAELDHVSHKPEELESSAWERFVVARRRKVEGEQKVGLQTCRSLYM